jgi:type VI secretion system protein ImpD/type VI secretion system protein ImpC
MSGEPAPESIPLDVAPAATAAETPLRAEVLQGRFFGARHAPITERLAAFTQIRGADTISAWFGPDLAPLLAADPDRLRAMLDRDITAIDALLSVQLDAILHHPRMRRFEGMWRGMRWLTDAIDAGARVKVKLLNAGWAELCRDLERAAEFDQSHLFRKVYEDEFGSPGGEPYGLLIIDHEIRHRPGPGAPTDDVGALKLLAGVAAAAFAPTILAASPMLLDVEAFTDLAGISDPTAIFRSAEYQRWRSLFAVEDVRFLGVVLPRVLARVPWEDDPARADGFRYREHAPGPEHRVWMSAGYAFAATAARAFAAYAWPADVRGVETDRVGGGLVEHFPIEPFDTDPDHVWVRPALEVVLTDRQERGLVDAGLMPLSGLPFGEEAVFGSVRSLQTPQQYGGANGAAATASARISAQINSMLCASRFAHCLKMLGREMVGSFRTADEIERQLQRWLSGYVNSNLSGGAESRSRFPLVAGSVTVKERPDRPGVFGCIIQLQPHFQLDDVAASFRLVTEIAAPGTVR